MTFWGLTIDGANKVYTQVVKQSFHVSMIALQTGSGTTEPIGVYARIQDTDFLLCTLKDGRVPQQPVDLNFGAGDTISFYINKAGVVHMTGYSDPDEMDFDSDEESEEEEVPDLVKMSRKDMKRALEAAKGPENKLARFEEEDDDESDEEEESDDGEESDDEMDDESDSEESEPVIQKPQKTPIKQNGAASKQQSKDKQRKEAMTPASPKDKQKKEPMTPAPAKKDKKNEPATPLSSKKPKTPSQSSPATPKRTLKGGVVSSDMKDGHGPVAAKGKTVSVYYRGTLDKSGKEFDSCLTGKPFKFRLGTGSVIKGWDIGVQGMKVGGRRRLTIPPHVAYGSKGTGPIPPNSTLVFDVELKAVH